MKKRNRRNGDTTSEESESTNAIANRPKDNALTQQRLPAISPKYDTNTVLPFLLIVGILFIGIGVGVLITSLNIQENIIPYTDCENDMSKKCKDEIINQDATKRDCNCKMYFNLTEDWEGEVLMYYGLKNFYQNHRLYVDSRNNDQLLGIINDYEDEDKYNKDKKLCAPFFNQSEKIYFPCGSIANSMFSDIISLHFINDTKVPLIRTGIAWKSDKENKFKNPDAATNAKELQRLLEENNYTKPMHWKRNLWELDKDDWSNNGLNNEDLIVWMRTAALPDFRKLYRRLPDGLPKGNYYLDIEYNFEVASFNGEKDIVFTTQSVLGGRNLFLGITYIVVGSFCTILGVVFLFVHLKWGSQIKKGQKTMQDLSR